MGCSVCREDISPLEAAYISAESKLKYDKIDLEAFINILIENSPNPLISVDDFKAVAEQYKLALTSSPSDPKIVEFYKKKFTRGKSFSFRQMATFAVLLNNRNPEIKAKTLFKAWTKDNRGVLNSEASTDLCKLLLTLSISDVNLWTLLLDQSVDMKKVYEDNRIMMQGADELGNLREKIFVNCSSVNEILFVAAFEKTENKKWLSSHGVRTELRRLGKNSRLALRASEVVKKERLKQERVDEISVSRISEDQKGDKEREEKKTTTEDYWKSQ
jgi:hypothetical protein